MKLGILVLSFSMLSSIAFGQRSVDIDPSYSSYNYKHPNKAAYAKKHNLDKPIRLGQIEVTQSEDYKHNHRVTTSRKVGVVTTDDRNKKYPNYKHPIQ